MILEISLQLCYNTNKAKGGKIHEPFEGSKIGYRNESKRRGGCVAPGPALCFQLGEWQDQSFPGKSESLG